MARAASAASTPMRPLRPRRRPLGSPPTAKVASSRAGARIDACDAAVRERRPHGPRRRGDRVAASRRAATVASTAPVAASILDSVPSCSFATQTSPPSSASAAGSLPTLIVWTTRPPCASSLATAPEPASATQTASGPAATATGRWPTGTGVTRPERVSTRASVPSTLFATQSVVAAGGQAERPVADPERAHDLARARVDLRDARVAAVGDPGVAVGEREPLRAPADRDRLDRSVARRRPGRRFRRARCSSTGSRRP